MPRRLNLVAPVDDAVGLRSWLKQRIRNVSPAQSIPLNLLSESSVQIQPPPVAGIDCSGAVRPWSVSRLEAILRESVVHPSQLTFQAARQARHCLSSFWLVAPTDQLSEIYAGAIGDLQRLLLNSPLVRQDLAADEQQWRDQLRAQLADPDHKPRQHNLLLALIPFTQPGQMSLENPLESLPDWMIRDYADYCQPELQDRLEQPVALLEPADGSASASSESSAEILSDQPFASVRGEEAMAWFRDQDVLTRMTTLINAYGMDPEDSETLQELSGLRSVVAQLWLDVEAGQMQTLFETSVGLVTRSLITCGFGQELIDQDDLRARRELVARAENLEAADGQAALLAAHLFLPAGAIHVENPDVLPLWLAKELETLQPVGG